jgi:histidinol-phosphate phosphatase family protein
MEDLGYVGDPDQVRVIEMGLDTLRWAQAHAYKLIVLTNQSGVARGKFTFDDVEAVNARLTQKFRDLGVFLDAIFVCPTLEGEDRKPRPGLALKAAAQFDLDLSRSFMVGDKDSDVLEDIPVQSFILPGQYPVRRTDRIATWSQIRAVLQAEERS